MSNVIWNATGSAEGQWASLQSTGCIHRSSFTNPMRFFDSLGSCYTSWSWLSKNGHCWSLQYWSFFILAYPHLTWIDWAHLIDLPAKIIADTQRWSEEYYPARFIPHCCLLLPRNCPGLVSTSSSHHSLLRHIPSPARSPPGSRAGCYSFGSPSTQDGQRPE